MTSTDMDSRDWSTLPDDVSFDQASGLPESIQISLGNMAIMLKTPTEFEKWMKSVSQTLWAFGLQNLIDIHIPRPKRSDPNAGKWLHLSRLVKTWLETGMSQELLKKIKSSGKRVELADEFVDQATRVFEGSKVNADMENVSALLSIQRSAFTNTAHFVCRFRDEIIHLQENGVPIPPYLAFFMLLNQLETNERPVVTSIITMLHSKTTNMDNWKIFKYRDFQNVCDRIFQFLNNDTIPDIQSDPVQISTPIEKPVDGTVLLADTRRHSPPSGVSPEQHVNAWCGRQPQVSDQGKCTYCAYPFHGPARCFYLNPHLRPLDWNPQDGLWIYKPEMNSGKRQWTKPASGDGNGHGIFDLLVDQLKKSESVANSVTQVSVTQGEEKVSVVPKEKPSSVQRLPLIGGLVDMSVDFVASRGDWQVVTTSAYHIAADELSLTEYQPYGPDDEPFEWAWYSGKREKALGVGKAKIDLLLADGNTRELIVDCFFQPNCPFSICSTTKLRKDHGVSFDLENLALYHFPEGNLQVFGEAFEENGVPFLRTTTFYPVPSTGAAEK